MQKIRLISRIFVGLLFTFSGFVKSLDPLGSTYKFTDYFTAFGMSWAEQLAFALALIMSTAEFLVGLTLLFNIKTKISAWGALLFMAFFTPLTLVLAISNPVTDCGCFGDALILTNWETFFKNIVILIPTLIVFFGRNKFQTYLSNTTEWIATGVLTIAIVGFSFYCLNHLPIIDFRPYKIGTHIPDKMIIPEGAKADVYKTTFIYENLKTGEQKEFDETNYPWQDTLNWKWKDSKSILVEEGYHAPIHDFVIESDEDGDITDTLLKNANYTFLLVAYNINKSSIKHQDKINALAKYCKEKNLEFVCATSSNTEEIEKFKQKTKADYKFASCDEITLKTIIRSNPGLVMLKKGTVMNMWSHSDIPDVKEFEENILK